jgi:ribosomal protein S18 acetylase RimI-like enzyme
VTRRPAIQTDTDFARGVHHEAYHDVVARQFGRWLLDEQDEFFAKAWDPARYEILLDDGVACGYTSVEERDQAIIVRELVVLPAFQSRGVGSTVLREAIDRARSRGLPVHLGVFHQNRAQELYRRFGFREVGRTETHLLMEWREFA